MQNEVLLSHRWKKGQSGNPKGRPKSAIPNLEKYLAKILSESKDGKIGLEEILLALKVGATRGNVRAAETILNRAYGKPKETIELINNEDSKYNDYFVFEMKPRGVQWTLFESNKRFIVACIGRQWGKSTVILLKLLFHAMNKKGTYFWVAPTFQQSKNIFLRCLENFKGIVKRKNEGELYIRLTSESIIFFKSAERPDNLRGFTLSGCVLDEYAMMKPIFEEIISPMLAVKNGFCYFISTPKGKNHFYDLYNTAKQNKELYDVFNFASDSSPFVDELEIQNLRNLLPSNVYKQEILAEFLDDSTNFFIGVKNCLVDCSYSLPIIKKPDLSNNYIIGLDLAKHEDFTVITVLQSNTGELVYFDRFNQKEYVYIAKKVQEISKLYNNALVVFDATGIGDAFKEHLDTLEIYNIPFVFTQTSKKNIIYNLALGIEKQKISFPNIPELVDELSSFGIYSKSNSLVLSAPNNKHDDIVMSLALAYSRVQEVFDYSKLIIKEELDNEQVDNFTY